jgi:hypothetical protein
MAKNSSLSPGVLAGIDAWARLINAMRPKIGIAPFDKENP